MVFISTKNDQSNKKTLFRPLLIPKGLTNFSKVSQALYTWELSSTKFILSSSNIKLFTFVFLVNFSVSLFHITSLTSVNVIKIAGACFFSGTVINTSQVLIYFFQCTYKESFPRVGRALKYFGILIFDSAILLLIVRYKYHTSHCK